RFSTITGWPKRALRLLASRRASVSVVPPGEKPQTMVTGPDGQLCARSVVGAARPAASAEAPQMNCRRSSLISMESSQAAEGPAPSALALQYSALLGGGLGAHNNHLGLAVKPDRFISGRTP